MKTKCIFALEKPVKVVEKGCFVTRLLPNMSKSGLFYLCISVL